MVSSPPRRHRRTTLGHSRTPGTGTGPLPPGRTAGHGDGAGRGTTSLRPVTETPPTSVLLWLDLEMTGLDVERDVIVEVAALATDTDLRALDGGIDLVVHQPDAVLEAMGEVVHTMHDKSGLLEAIRSSDVTLEQAGEELLAYVRRHSPEPRTVPLCGNSIGVDRRFLARYLPAVEEHLHYRSIDVSSLKELCRRWYPDAYRHRPPKETTHRALDDVRESIAELAYYREAVFR